jgi:hypothetical protein
VRHDPLPDDVELGSEIRGGKWSLTTLRGSFSGRVTGGTITNNGDDTFTIAATLRLQKRGSGNLVVQGLLDHRDLPFTFDGELLQP